MLFSVVRLFFSDLVSQAQLLLFKCNCDTAAIARIDWVRIKALMEE